VKGRIRFAALSFGGVRARTAMCNSTSEKPEMIGSNLVWSFGHDAGATGNDLYNLPSPQHVLRREPVKAYDKIDVTEVRHER
jgi:hypothetical protein